MATAILVSLTLSGCWSSGADEKPSSGEPSPSTGAEETPAFTSYVALGDSYTAAPFVPQTDLAEGCLRSGGNYPTLLAEELGVTDVRDVSCSAAQTRDVVSPQRVADGQGTVPAQIRAVDAGTDLVTIGIGGNDEDLFASLVGCVGGFGPAAPPADDATPDACLGPADSGPADAIARTGTRVTRVLRAVQRRAPEAEVVLVGYPRLLGDTSGCSAFPIDEADVPTARALERALARTLEGAARRADVSYLDAYALSRGHEICADAPWVNGRETDQARALAFHPFAEGQQAIAAALAEQLGETAP